MKHDLRALEEIRSNETWYVGLEWNLKFKKRAATLGGKIRTMKRGLWILTKKVQI
jgi:hypothetical protein